MEKPCERGRLDAGPLLRTLKEGRIGTGAAARRLAGAVSLCGEQSGTEGQVDQRDCQAQVSRLWMVRRSNDK